MQDCRSTYSVEQDRHARAERRIERMFVANDLHKTFSFLSFWREWGQLTLMLMLGITIFVLAMYVTNGWVTVILRSNGGLIGFFAIVAIFGGILAAGGIGLAVGDGIAIGIERRANIHYVIIYRDAKRLGVGTTPEQDNLYCQIIRHYKPEALAELGPEPPRPSAPAHAATPIPQTAKAANRRLHLIP